MIRQLELNDSILIILRCWKMLRRDIKLSSLSHWAYYILTFFHKKWLLLFKAKIKFPDSTSLRPGWIVPLVSSGRIIGNTGCWVFKRGIQNWKDFCLKINVPKGNYWILRIGLMGMPQKMPKFDFQSQFLLSKIIGIFLNFFFIKEYQFRSTSFVIDIFW